MKEEFMNVTSKQKKTNLQICCAKLTKVVQKSNHVLKITDISTKH